MIYGPGFQESIEVLRILSWYLPLIFCNMVLWRVLIVRGEQRVVFRVQFITEIIQVLLAVWLIPALGCNGAAWAVLGGNLAYTVCPCTMSGVIKRPFPWFNYAGDLSWHLL